MKANARNYLSLARKAGRIQVGEEPAVVALRAGHARLLVVARDAGDHTLRRARALTAGGQGICVTVPFSKEELGQALGRSVVSLAALTDSALSLAFLQALEDPERYAGALADLTHRTQRARQRQKEAKAHRNNLRRGVVKERSPARPSAGSPRPAGAEQTSGGQRQRRPQDSRHGEKSHGGAKR